MAEPLRKRKTKARSPRSKNPKVALPQPEIDIPASQKPLAAADIGVDYDQFKQRYVENQRAQADMGASRPKAILDPASSMEMQSRANQAIKSANSGIRAIPAPLLGLTLGVGVAATAHYFWRRRKSSRGKMIVERVRR